MASLMLPPLFLHFALMFSERPDSWARTDTGRHLLPLLYLPAVLLGGARVAAFARGNRSEATSVSFSTAAVFTRRVLMAGLVVMTRALARSLGHVAASAAMDRLGHRARYVAVRLRVRACPFALGFTFPRHRCTSVLLVLAPLGFASAIVRYRLMDVEVIIKRALVYGAALAGMAAIYAIVLKLASEVFFNGGDPMRRPGDCAARDDHRRVMLKPLKNADSGASARSRVLPRSVRLRRALVGFARDLNSDLDLFRLAERLVHRVMETLVVDRMALMLAPAATGREETSSPSPTRGLAGDPPALRSVRRSRTRLISGHTLALDDPLVQGGVNPEEIDFWREGGIHYFVPASPKKGRSRSWRSAGERHRAAEQRGHGAARRGAPLRPPRRSRTAGCIGSCA